jgi:hypothetical protein
MDNPVGICFRDEVNRYFSRIRREKKEVLFAKKPIYFTNVLILWGR